MSAALSSLMICPFPFFDISCISTICFQVLGMLSTAIFDQAAAVLLYNQSFVIKAANVAEQHYHLDKFPTILAVGGEKASAVNYYFYLSFYILPKM